LHFSLVHDGLYVPRVCCCRKRSVAMFPDILNRYARRKLTVPVLSSCNSRTYASCATSCADWTSLRRAARYKNSVRLCSRNSRATSGARSAASAWGGPAGRFLSSVTASSLEPFPATLLRRLARPGLYYSFVDGLTDLPRFRRSFNVVGEHGPQDVVVIFSACPIDITPVNGEDRIPKSVAYEIIDCASVSVAVPT
jgi:hypothetical protein